MTRMLFIAAAAALVLGIGFLLGRQTSHSEDRAAPSEARQEILYWVAPMDSSYRRDEPGKSPMGMDLVPVYASDAGPGVVTVDPAIVNRLGVRTADVERGVLPRIIETSARLSWNESTLTHVHSRADGWVESLAIAAEGDPVRAGQRLFELYSPTLVNAQKEFLSVLGSGNAGLRQASRDRLAALGMAADDIAGLERDRRVRQRVPFVAATDGVVAMLGVRDGKFVTPDTDILSIAELGTLWVHVDVLERQAGWVEPGQRVSLTLDAFPGERFESRIDYVYPEVDSVTRTLKLRTQLDNPDGRLRPGMLADATIDGRETGPINHVPREAVIRGGRGNRVVVALGDGRFESREVLVGIESGDRVAIRRGLAAGESVVVSGQFLIDSESAIDQALSRYGDGHEGHRP